MMLLVVQVVIIRVMVILTAVVDCEDNGNIAADGEMMVMILVILILVFTLCVGTMVLSSPRLRAASL